ncbi:MAG: peptidylprolyl isomerase [Chlorobi bacterium]|nr:peptidylprolyl isomerase [Chlorobiota bacterium]
MKAEKNNVISLTYELKTTEKDGKIIDAASEEQPLDFIYGSGMMLPKFEENLAGLKKGDTFKFMLTAEEGYGKRNENNLADVPMNVFEQNGKIEDNLLTAGNIIPLQDQDGNHFNGKIISVNDGSVKLDFNHPLADENLYFSGKIVSVREATKQELEHGHVHTHGHNH